MTVRERRDFGVARRDCFFAITSPNGASGYLSHCCGAVSCIADSISSAASGSNGAGSEGSFDSWLWRFARFRSFFLCGTFFRAACGASP